MLLLWLLCLGAQGTGALDDDGEAFRGGEALRGGEPGFGEGGARGGARVHTIFSTECDDYFDYQSIALVHSFRQSGMTGGITRLLACDEDAKKQYQHLDVVPTFVHPNFRSYAPPDIYAPYNKPGAIDYYLTHADTSEFDYIVYLDADMLVRNPISPVDVGAKPGTIVAGYYGYLQGTDNGMANAFLPLDRLPYMARVGGWMIARKQDMMQVTPHWLNFTRVVRNCEVPSCGKTVEENMEIWKLTGDAFITRENPRPWISEMYGYVFGSAMAKMNHTTNDNVMAYPAYNIGSEPLIIHYGIGIIICKDEHGKFQSFADSKCPEGEEAIYKFDKHWVNNNLVLDCGIGRPFSNPPAFDAILENIKGGRPSQMGLKLAIETIEGINVAVDEFKAGSCSAEQLEAKLCLDIFHTCEAWAREGECDAPGLSEFMTKSCPQSCNRCHDDPSPCRDMSEGCPSWSQRGECSRNPGFMLIKCPVSCDSCEGLRALPPTLRGNITEAPVIKEEVPKEEAENLQGANQESQLPRSSFYQGRRATKPRKAGKLEVVDTQLDAQTSIFLPRHVEAPDVNSLENKHVRAVDEVNNRTSGRVKGASSWNSLLWVVGVVLFSLSLLYIARKGQRKMQRRRRRRRNNMYVD